MSAASQAEVLTLTRDEQITLLAWHANAASTHAVNAEQGSHADTTRARQLAHAHSAAAQALYAAIRCTVNADV